MGPNRREAPENTEVDTGKILSGGSLFWLRRRKGHLSRAPWVSLKPQRASEAPFSPRKLVERPTAREFCLSRPLLHLQCLDQGFAHTRCSNLCVE